MGYSSRPAHGQRLGVQARLAAEVLRRTGNGPAIIVGHSLGAAVALRLALEAPDLVRALVLLAPACTPWQGQPIWWARLAATPILGHLFCGLIIPNLGPPLARANIDRNFAPAAAPENYYDKARSGSPSAPARAARSMCAIQARNSPPRRRIIRRFSRPRSSSPPRKIASSAPSGMRARWPRPCLPGVVIAPDCGHMPHQLRPDLGIAAILRVSAMAGAPAQS